MRKAGLIVLAATLALVVLLLLSWAAGFAVGAGGALVHLLLVIAMLVAPVGTVIGVALLIFGRRQDK